MSGASVLLKGQLFKAPEQRQSKAGKTYTTATLKVRDGDSTDWWKLVAFSEAAQAELLRFKDCDALAAQGVLRVEPYEHNGELRVTLTCIAEQVLALRQPPRRRENKTEPSVSHRESDDMQSVPFDDRVPF